MFSGRKSKKYWLVPAIALLALFSAGCAKGAPEYQAVAKELDAGGTLYVISDTTSFQESVKNIAESLAVKNVQSLRRRQLNILIANALLQASGVTDISTWGASSISSQMAEFPMHNKVFLHMKPDAPGIINRIFSGENREIWSELALLPRDVTVAFAADLQIPAIIETIKSFGPLGTGLLDKLPLDMENILSDSTGVCTLALILPHNLQKLSISSVWFYAALPDKNEKLFNTLQKVATLLLKFEYDAKAKRLTAAPGFNNLAGCSPVILHQNGKVVIYSSPLAENYFTAADTRRMGSDPDFIGLRKRLPEKACAMWFVRAREFYGKNNTLFGTEKSFSMISRTENGLLMQSFCASDINAYVINNAWFFYNFFKESSKQVKKGLSKAKKSSAPRPQRDNSIAACSASLRKAAPEAKLGAKRLYYCPTTRKTYVRFDIHKLKSDTKLPVLMDRPDSHRGEFNVLFSDDSVETFQLEKQNNCLRMISFLQTRLHWQEQIFRELVRQADEFDRNTK